MSFSEVHLGEMIHVKHGFAFRGDFFREEGKYVILTPGHFFEAGGFRDRPDKDRFYVGDFPESFILSKRSLIIAMTEQGAGLLGSSALVPEDDRYLHNQRIGLVTITEPDQLDDEYLYRLFNTRAVRAQINASASGTKVRHTAPERVYRVKVSIPTIDVQRKIASVIAQYDALIDNNRRRISLLEKAAGLLYEEWFVRFRFPGHERAKFNNGLPEGWKRMSVEDAAAFMSRGITPVYDDEASCLVINQKCVRGGRLETDLARRQSKKVSEEKLVQFGDVLINSTGEGTLGRVAQVLEELGQCTVDSHLTIVRPKPEIGVHIFGMAFKQRESYLSGQGRGATNQTELSKDTIGALTIDVPPPDLSENFETKAETFQKEIVTLVAQNRVLASVRDLLLPRLMSGEVEV
jgi:type I restriction enzyme S subunit